MKMSFLDEIILYCLYKINGERSVASVYHLFNGKKSSQTLQDMHLFKLTPFFKTYERMTRQALSESVEYLKKNRFIHMLSEHQYIVSEKGIIKARSLFDRYPFLSLLNGWTYQNARVYWERLSLLVQVVANLSQNVSRYVPVQKNNNVQEWLKDYLRKSTFKRSQFSKELYWELETCLAGNRFIDPSVVVLRFTGTKTVGLTEEQAAKALDMDDALYHYQFLAFIHFLIKTSETSTHEFPILYGILEKLQEPVPLTFSTKATMNLLKKGLSIEEISITRGLKINTIQDHIVELALNLPGFDISPYVDNEKEKDILSAAKRASSMQLKHIRSQVEDADYFEIRLVMAKYGGEINYENGFG